MITNYDYPKSDSIFTAAAAACKWIKCATRHGVGVNQAYSLLSITHGHITDCKFMLDSVVYASNSATFCFFHFQVARSYLM